MKRAVVALLLLFSLIFATAAQAQSGTDAAKTSLANNSGQPASYGALADLLENDKTRNQLVEQLRDLAVTPDGIEPASRDISSEAISPLATASHASSSTGIVARMQHFSRQLKNDLTDSWRVIKGLFSNRGVDGVTIDRWMPALYGLVLAIVGVSVAYLLLRIVANAAFRRIDLWVTRKRSMDDTQHPDRQAKLSGSQGLRKHHMPRIRIRGRKFAGVVAALIVDVVATLLAALVGYAVVIAFTSHGASAYLFAIQFLTAFVMVEVAKALSRAIFSTRYAHLRLLPVANDVAQFWNRWLSTIISITVYSLLVIVPVIQAVLTRAVGNLLGLVLMLAVYLYAVKVVWSKRRWVRDGLTQAAERTTTAIFATLILILARIWHWVALVYLTVLFVVSQTQQQKALSFIGNATAQALIAIVIGGLAMAGVSALAHRSITLPENWRRSLPLLETRLNAYIPAFLQGLRLLIFIFTTLVVLDAWKAFNLVEWLSSDAGQAAVSTITRVGIILAIAALGWTVLASVIEHRLTASQNRRLPTEREKTLLMLFRNAAAITIATLTILVLLSQIGIDIGPLIAGAGVAGLAIGFGAQKLVQDVITGVFIQLENGMNQNDVVQVAGLFGTVEKITIRSVVIRTMDGGYHLIPFSSIDTLSNHTRDYGYHIGEYTIPHRENIQDAIAQLELAFKVLMQDPSLASAVLEEISIPGVIALNEKGFTIRVMIKTSSGNQWMIERAYNRLVKEHFDAAGIEMPYPQTMLRFGRDKQGRAAPLDVRDVSKLEDALDLKDAARTS